MPAHEVRIEDGRVLINRTPSSKRTRKPHASHPLAREVKREPGPIRVACCAGFGARKFAPGRNARWKQQRPTRDNANCRTQPEPATCDQRIRPTYSITLVA